MSRSLWRCRNPHCPVPHGAVLGRVTANGALVLGEVVNGFRIYLDSRRVEVRCPRCGQAREFRGTAVFSERPSRREAESSTADGHFDR